MNQFKCIIIACLLILSKDCLAAAPDHHFCVHTYYTQTFAETMRSPNEVVGMFDGPTSSLVLPHSPHLSIADPTSIGTFINSDVYSVASPSFCQQINEELRTGDFNGDGHEDLICRKADGSFRVRLFSDAKSFVKEQKIESFMCSSPKDLQIGDFDGDKVDDILCTDYISSPKTSHIYYGARCGSNNNGRHYMQAYKMSHHRNMQRSRMNSGHFNSNEAKKHLERLCKGTLFEYTIIPCSVSGATVAGSGDINNDGYDDIVCREGDFFSYHLSTGKRGVIFQTSTTANTINRCVAATHEIRIVNIDSHPNEEILCIPDDGVLGIQVYYYNNQNDLIMATTPAIPSCSPFCSSVAGRLVSDLVVLAGDFNGDGKADVMCRFTDGANIKTEIIYSNQI